MIPKTTTWICDRCGETVSASEGLLQWLVIPKNDESGYRREGLELVHIRRPDRPKCAYDAQSVFKAKNATTSDLNLERLDGHDGLMLLLSFIAEGDFAENKEIIEVIKRLLVPGYEQVRHHLERAASEGVCEPNTPEGFPEQTQIEAVIKWLESGGQNN